MALLHFPVGAVIHDITPRAKIQPSTASPPRPACAELGPPALVQPDLKCGCGQKRRWCNLHAEECTTLVAVVGVRLCCATCPDYITLDY